MSEVYINADRIARALECLAAGEYAPDAEGQYAASDLVADVLHWAAYQGFDPAVIVARALRDVRDERGEHAA